MNWDKGYRFGIALKTTIVIVAVFLAGCEAIPRNVSMNDPEVNALIAAASSFDRTTYGFFRIASNADVRLELRPTEHYDAIPQIIAKSHHTIAFRKKIAAMSGLESRRPFKGQV
jgi:hypothetical protein